MEKTLVERKRWTDAVSGLLSKLPPFPGKLRLVTTLGRMIINLRHDSRVVYSPCPDTWLRLNLQDRVERLIWGGCWEPHVRRCLEALLHQGDTFLDIGAHIGYHTVVGARLVGHEGRVWAFEPDPILYGRLVEHVQALPWVRPLQCAVWEESGTLLFERSSTPDESGWGTVALVRNMSQGEQVTVEAVSLDAWCERCSCDAIHVIKIDAEGSELAILKGAESTISAIRPIIILEMNDNLLKSTGASSAELTKYLLDHHYCVFSIAPFTLQQLDTGLWRRDVSEGLCVPQEKVQLSLLALKEYGFKL